MSKEGKRSVLKRTRGTKVEGIKKFSLQRFLGKNTRKVRISGG